MGTIKTTNIEPIADNGTVTLGSSGDTFTIPSGVTMVNNGTQSGFGGVNTPAFFAYMSGDQSLTNNTTTKVTFDTERFDVGSCYDSSTNYRFTVPSGEAGKYFISNQVRFESGANANLVYCYAYLYKNGSTNLTTHENSNTNLDRSRTLTVSGVLDLSVGDYMEAFAFISVSNSGAGQNIDAVEAGLTSFFQAYKIIE